MRLKLKMIILGKYGRQKRFARAINKDEVWLSRVINGLIDPKTAEQIAIASKLDVDDVEGLFTKSGLKS